MMNDHVARMHTQFQSKPLKGRDHLVNVDADGKIILKLVLHN
jgi:hypothetical protein